MDVHQLFLVACIKVANMPVALCHRGLIDVGQRQLERSQAVLQ